MSCFRFSLAFVALVGAALMAAPASAQVVDVTVTIENLAPTNSVSFSPLRVGFHSGLFDAFDINEAATAPIISVAEGGSGADWFPAFEAADPDAVLGSVVNGGPAIPAGNAGVGNSFSSTATNTFRVDTSQNRFFTFANMVIPSNDLFLGNDNAIELFDASGNLLLTSISQFGSSIWDANSEEAIVANGAFVVGSDNGARVDEMGTIEFAFDELAVFDGAATPAGFNFTDGLFSTGDELYRVSFSATAVPEPTSLALLSLCAVGFCGLHNRRRA